MKRVLFILSGPSGVGKATVGQRLIQRVGNLSKVITYTSRSPRPGETSDVTYHFITKEEFESKIQHGEFFEWERVYGDAYYGSPKDPFESIPEGHDALLEIGAGGMEDYASHRGDVVSIFLAPPSMDALLNRIRKRGGGETNLSNRLRSAASMIRRADEYQYVLVNDDLETTVDRVAEIVAVERMRAKSADLANQLKQQVDQWPLEKE